MSFLRMEHKWKHSFNSEGSKRTQFSLLFFCLFVVVFVVCVCLYAFQSHNDVNNMWPFLLSQIQSLYKKRCMQTGSTSHGYSLWKEERGTNITNQCLIVLLPGLGRAWQWGGDLLVVKRTPGFLLTFVDKGCLHVRYAWRGLWRNSCVREYGTENGK